MLLQNKYFSYYSTKPITELPKISIRVKEKQTEGLREMLSVKRLRECYYNI